MNTLNTGVITTGGDISLYAETLEQCLKTTAHFSGKTIWNICEGTSTYVPFGFWDMAGLSVLFAVGVVVVMFLSILLMVAFDY